MASHWTSDDLVLQQADGADIEGCRKQQFVAGEKGEFRAAAAHVDIEVGVFLIEVFRDMVFVNQGGFIAAADDLDLDARLFFYLCR